MAESWRQADIRCPFFRTESEKEKTVNCEGIIEGSVICSRFRSKKKRERQLREYCEEDYTHCPIYRAVEKKYDDP